MTGFRRSTSGPSIYGDEKLDDEAMKVIRWMAGKDQIKVLSGFDFGSKVIALTHHKVLVAGASNGAVLHVDYAGIPYIGRDGRTLVVRTNHDEHRFRMGNDEVVEELVLAARGFREEQAKGKTQPSQATTTTNDQDTGIQAPTQGQKEKTGIAERVKFWEEQDRINQELIPRVIRQHELLTQHIGDHEMLPIVAAIAAKEALEQAQSETLRQLETATAIQQELTRQLEESKTQVERQSQELAQARGEREKLSKELQEAMAEREKLSRELEETRAERETLSQETQEAKAEPEKLKKDRYEELTRLKATVRIPKIIGAVASATALVAIIIAVVL